MSLSLIADYQSSSSDSEKEAKSSNNKPPAPLASALDMLGENPSISSSVFTNPYREAENYETSLLEQHVKMTVINETKNTKPEKMCYKFLKGKCRLADRCRFLHTKPHGSSGDSQQNSDSEDQSTALSNQKSKKRCGLKDDLIPPKKFMKSYKNK